MKFRPCNSGIFLEYVVNVQDSPTFDILKIKFPIGCPLCKKIEKLAILDLQCTHTTTHAIEGKKRRKKN